MLEAAMGYSNKSTLCAFDMYSLNPFLNMLGCDREDLWNWEQELDLLLCKHEALLLQKREIIVENYMAVASPFLWSS